MKLIVGKIGTALLIMWIVGMTTLLLIGLSVNGPIDGHEFINVWTFYGFVLGTPVVAVAMMRLGNHK
jgi:uncharacterized membrane protein YdcZ (DUF606 family)